MDREFKTTFIPKKNLTQARETISKPIRSKSKSILGILALLVFVTTLVTTVGVFIYKQRLSSVINSRIDSINIAEKAFEPAVILELRKLDIRLRSATELLNQHIALSDFFVSLGQSTLPDVSFSDFSLDYEDGRHFVTMTGEARGYLPIAQQSNLFEQNRYIENPIFSEFVLNETGNVSFNLNFSLNKDLITFGRNTSLDSFDTTDEALDEVIIEDNQDTLSPGTPVNFTN